MIVCDAPLLVAVPPVLVRGGEQWYNSNRAAATGVCTDAICRFGVLDDLRVEHVFEVGVMAGKAAGKRGRARAKLDLPARGDACPKSVQTRVPGVDVIADISLERDCVRSERGRGPNVQARIEHELGAMQPPLLRKCFR